MRYQTKAYSCGAAAVVNALRLFGKKVSEKRVLAHSFTTRENGTDEHGIVSALRNLGFNGDPFEEETEIEAKAVFRSSNPVIICTQALQHWVTVISLEDGYYMIIDPARTKKNKKENGIHVVNWKELKRTWQTRDGSFYGILCSKGL